MCRALHQAWPSLSRVRPEQCPEGGEEAARVGGWGLGPAEPRLRGPPSPLLTPPSCRDPAGAQGR